MKVLQINQSDLAGGAAITQCLAFGEIALRDKQAIIERINKAHLERNDFLNRMKQRQKKGLKLACNCAKILKEEFKVNRVVLFGSLLNSETMTYHSDIDLAVWGLKSSHYLKAVAMLLNIDTDFIIDLVEAEQVKPYILKAIEGGIDL